MLRVYFRNNRKLVSKISRLINDMILSYYKASAGKKIQSAAVFAFQSYGDFIRYNPHYHSLILEGGFDDTGNFIFIPIADTAAMTECFRMLVVQFFVDNDLIPKRPGNHSRNILTNKKLFDAADFIAELTQHIPPLRMRLVRYYGLYSSRSRWNMRVILGTAHRKDLRSKSSCVSPRILKHLVETRKAPPGVDKSMFE